MECVTFWLSLSAPRLGFWAKGPAATSRAGWRRSGGRSLALAARNGPLLYPIHAATPVPVQLLEWPGVGKRWIYRSMLCRGFVSGVRPERGF